MIEYFQGLPYPLAVAALFVVVVLRAGASYAIGRGVEAGASRTRLRRVLEGDRFRRARGLVDRWGAPIVVLSFLTIGFQTVANVAAGVARMPLRRYLPALGIGGLLWAFLYATAGVLGVAGFMSLYAVSPVAAILVTVGIASAVTAFVVMRLRRETTSNEDGDEPTTESENGRLAAHDRRP